MNEHQWVVTRQEDSKMDGDGFLKPMSKYGPGVGSGSSASDSSILMLLIGGPQLCHVVLQI